MIGPDRQQGLAPLPSFVGTVVVGAELSQDQQRVCAIGGEFFLVFGQFGHAPEVEQGPFQVAGGQQCVGQFASHLGVGLVFLPQAQQGSGGRHQVAATGLAAGQGQQAIAAGRVKVGQTAPPQGFLFGVPCVLGTKAKGKGGVRGDFAGLVASGASPFELGSGGLGGAGVLAVGCGRGGFGRLEFAVAQGGFGPAPCGFGIAFFLGHAGQRDGCLGGRGTGGGFFEGLAGFFAAAKGHEAVGQAQGGVGVGGVGLPEHAEHARGFLDLAGIQGKFGEAAERHPIARVEFGDLEPPLAGDRRAAFVVGERGQFLGGAKAQTAGLLELLGVLRGEGHGLAGAVERLGKRAILPRDGREHGKDLETQGRGVPFVGARCDAYREARSGTRFGTRCGTRCGFLGSPVGGRCAVAVEIRQDAAQVPPGAVAIFFLPQQAGQGHQRLPVTGVALQDTQVELAGGGQVLGRAEQFGGHEGCLEIGGLQFPQPGKGGGGPQVVAGQAPGFAQAAP